MAQPWHPPPAPYYDLTKPGPSHIPPPATVKSRYDQYPNLNQDGTLVPRKHLSFDEDVLDREDPNTFQDARCGHSSPLGVELPGISPLQKDAAIEKVAKALASGTQDVLGPEPCWKDPRPWTWTLPG